MTHQIRVTRCTLSGRYYATNNDVYIRFNKNGTTVFIPKAEYDYFKKNSKDVEAISATKDIPTLLRSNLKEIFGDYELTQL